MKRVKELLSRFFRRGLNLSSGVPSQKNSKISDAQTETKPNRNSEGNQPRKSVLSSLKTRLNIFFLETLYKIHIRIRYVHDTAYSRGGWYKGYSDKDISKTIHKAGLATFVVSFIAFTAMQSLWPYLFTLKPRKVQAGQTTTTWNTQSEFETNSSTGENMPNDGSTTRSNVSWNASDAGMKLNQGWSLGTNTLLTNNITNDVDHYNNKRKIVRTSNGTLVFFYYDGSLLQYKTSTDQGATWSANISTGVSATDATVDIDASDNIHLSFSGSYRKLTTSNPSASPPTWSNGTSYSYTSSGCSGQGYYIYGDGNIIATSTKLFRGWKCSYSDMYTSSSSSRVSVSTDLSGTSWTSYTVNSAVGSDVLLAPYSSNTRVAAMFYKDNAYLGWSNTAISSISWSAAATAIATTVNSNFSVTSDGNTIHVTTTSSGGIKYANYASGWSAYTNVTTSASDKSPSISYNGTNALIFYMKYVAASQYNVAYRSNANWSGENIVENTNNDKIALTTIAKDSGVVPVFWYDPYASSVYPLKYNRYYSTYQSPGTIGNTGNGLRVGDTTSGKVFKWSQVKFVGTVATGTGVQFQVRPAASYGGGGAAGFVNPADNAASTWSTAIPAGTYTTGSPYTLSVSSNVSQSKTLEVKVNATGGASTPLIQQVIVVYDVLEAPVNGNTTAYKADGSTLLKNSSGSNVTAGNGGGYTKEASVKITTTGLTCTDCGTSSARKIEVEAKPVGTSFAGTGTVLGDYSDTTYNSTATLSGLSAGTSYHVRLRATDGQGRVSAWTNYASDGTAFTVDTTAPTQPGAPSTTSPTADTTPAWSWSASTDAASGLATTNTYKVYWDTVAGGTTNSAFSDTNSYTHSVELAEGTWYVKVEAYDNAGNVSTVSSNGSVEIDATSPAAFELSSPSNNDWSTTASPTLAWNASSDANGLAEYELWIDGARDTDAISNATTSVTPTTPLTAGDHTWYVKAIDNAGNVTQSTSTYTVKVDLAVPNVSGLTLGTATPALNPQTSINVTSTGTVTDDGTLAGYRIFKKQVSDQAPSTPVLTPGAGTNVTTGAYKYIIVGYNSDNFEIEATAESSITTTTDNQHIGITWSAMTGATGYKVYRTDVGGATVTEKLLKDVGNVTAYTDDGTDTLSSTDIAIKPQYQYVGDTGSLPTGASPYTVSSLTSGQTYSFYLKAYDLAGRYSTYTGNASGSNDPSRATVDTAPPQAPSNLVVTPTVSGTSLDLSWSGAFDGAGVTKYRIYMATASLGTYTAQTAFDVDIASTMDDTGTTRTQTVTGLVDSKTYYFRVSALDASSNESTQYPQPPTAGVEGAPPDVTAPQFLQGAGLTATPASAYTMNLSWSNASDYSSDGITEGTAQSGSSFTGWYKVYRDISATGDFTTEAGGDCSNTSSTSCTDSGLNALTTYYYKVKAIDKAGSSTDAANAGNLSSAKLPATSIPSGTTYTDQVPTSTTSNSVTATTSGGNTGSEVKISFTGAASSTYENGVENRTDGAGLAIDYYRVYRFPAGTSITEPSTTNGAVIESTVATWASGLGGTLVNSTTYDGGTVGVNGNVTAASEAAQLADASNQRGEYYYEFIDNTSYANVVDSGLTDGTTYQYVVFAYDKEKPWLVDSQSQNIRFATKASTILVTTPDTTASTDSSSISVETIDGIESSMPRLVVSWIIPTQVTRATTATVSSPSLSSTSGTSLVVSGGAGSQFVVGQFIKIDSEIVKITAIVTDTLTVTRAQGGSTAATHSASTAISILDFSAYKLYKDSGLGYEEITSQTFTSLNENYFVDSDIQEGSTYSYKVTVVDDAGRFKGYVANQQNQVVNSGVNNESTGVTVSYDPSADLVAPTIDYTHQTELNRIGYSVTPSSATISWTTTENASSVIDYGTSASLGNTFGYSEYIRTSHQVTLTDLNPSTTYYFRIKSSDAAGNLTTKDNGGDYYTFTTTTDTTVPANPTTTSAWNANTKDSALSSGNWYNYAAPRFEWTGATDSESSVSGYLVYFGTSSTGTPSAYQADATPNYYTASSLSSGSTYYLRVKTRDAATNDSEATTLFTYKYDSTAPSSTITSPANGANLASVSTITGTATDTYSNVAGAKISVKRNSDNKYLNSGMTDFNQDTETYLDATGQGSFSLDVTSVTFSDGTYTLSSKASDSVGNEETPSTTKTFRIDTTNPPQVDLVNPVNIQNLSSANPTFTFNATEEDNGSGLSYFELYIDGELNTDNPERIPVTANPIKKKIITPLTEGSHTWYVKAYDKVGNSSTSGSTLSVNIDLSKPTSTITSPTTYQYLNDATLNITGTATKSVSSNAAVQSVYVSVTKRGTGLNWTPVTTLTGSTDTKNWSYTWTLPSNDDGEYFIISKAIDAAGNEENYGAGMTVAVDKTAPTISNVDVTDITTTTANINFETSEGTTAVIDYGLAQSYGTTFNITGTNTKHTGRLTSLAEGATYNYQITVTDAAGNETSTANSTLDMVGLDHDDPVISDLTVSSISSSGASISWTTDEVATSQVMLSTSSEFTSPAYFPETIDEANLNKAHRVTLTGLTSNTAYYIKAKSKDSSDNEGETAGNDSFSTLRVPIVSPVGIVITESAEDKSITVTWTSDEPTTSIVEYALEDGFTAYDKSAIGDKAAPTTTHTVTITDFTPLSFYKFRVGGTNAQGVTAYQTATPDTFDTDFIDNVAPVISFTNTQSLSRISPQSETSSGVIVSVSSTTINWETNEAADSEVIYRKEGETEYRKGSLDPKISGKTSHSVALLSLTPSTKYYFKIKSTDASNNISTSDEYNFTTQSLGITPPKVAATASSATISWNTNIDSTSQVEYQKQNSNISSKIEGDASVSRSHNVTLKNLSPGRYSYKVKSVDSDKNIAESTLLTFEIPTSDSGSISAPRAAKIEEREITATSAKITWESTMATTSWVEYGSASGNYTMLAGNNDFNTSHLVEVLNLVPGTTYYYRVKGKDTAEIEYFSEEAIFTAVLKPEISNVKLSEITSYSATLTFDTNVDTTAFVALGKDTNYGGGVGKNEFKRNHSILLEDLEDASTYHYQISVKDKLANEVKTSDSTFNTPLDTTGPAVKEVKIDLLPMGTDDETASAIISWTTDKPASTQVEYDEGIVGNTYSQKTIPDKSLNRAHTVIVKELIPGSTYRFRIISEDKKANVTKSQPYNFVTPTKEKSILQLIIRSLEETFSWVKTVGVRFGEVKTKIFGEQ